MMTYIRRALAVLLVMMMTITALPMAAIAEEMQTLDVLTPEQLEELLAASEEEGEPEAEAAQDDEAVQAELTELPAELDEIAEALPEADFVPAEEMTEPAEEPAQEEESEEVGMTGIMYVLSDESLNMPVEEAKVNAEAAPEAYAMGYSPEGPSAARMPSFSNGWQLAEYAGLSVDELAAKLGLSVEEVLALTEEETAIYQTELYRPLAAGSMALDTSFSNTAYSTGTTDYTIKISRSGRYILTTTANRYLEVNVYDGNKQVGGVIHYCGGSTSNWCVDLEAGKTYTFTFQIDTRYSSGSCTFTSKLKLYTDGSYKDRAASLAYDVYTSFAVNYSNDFRIFSFTALSGKKYRITTTGSLSKRIEICDSNFNVLQTKEYHTGTKSFEVSLNPGSTYYLKIHGLEPGASIIWYRTGSGQVKIECLDKIVDPITFTMNKKAVNPGTGDSIKFTIKSKYAKKVRLVLDGMIYGDEVNVSDGKATIKASFHDSGSHKIQVQGYYNNAWSLMSDPVTFTVNKKAALPKPSFSSVINNTGTDQNYVVHWYALDGANKYIVNVQSGDVVIYTVTVDNTCVTIPGSVLGTPGMYVLDVYGIGKNVQQSEKPASAKVTVVDQKIILDVVSSLKGNVITWTANAKNASASAKIRFDLYNSVTGLVKQGSYGAGRQFTYTCTASGEYYVIVYVQDGGDTITGASESVKYVQPKAKSVAIQYNGKDAGKSMSVYLDKPNVKLSALINPADANQAVTWKSSNTKIAKIAADGTITPLKKGSVTITATAKDGSKKKDTITVTVKRLVSKIEISGSTELASGMSTTLKKKVLPADASKKSVKWTSSDKSIATVNSEGVVTAAKGITARKTVTITAEAKDESGVKATYRITVCPKVTSVTLTKGGADAGKSAEIDMSSGKLTLQLDKIIAPGDAIQTVKWTSSDKKIASVSDTGLVTAHKPGKVTITVTAKDGSKKKDSITITVKRLVKSIAITGKNELTSGAKTTLKVTCTPANATNKSVKWTSSDTTIATVDSKGVVTAKKGLTEPRTVTITAETKDGSGVKASFKITVYPKTKSVSILANGEAAKKGTVSKGSTLQLKAVVEPGNALQKVTWSSSNKKIVSVSDTGLVKGVKKGSATITVKTADGKKATFVVKVN